MILWKIERDIKDRGFEECHHKLVDKLVGLLDPAHKKKDSCALP